MGFNLEKNYVERTAVYQFISDHPQVMLDVYDVVCKLCEQKNVPKERVIDLLNCAYKICTIATHPEGTLADVISIRHQYRIMPGFYSLAVCVAYYLLTLHQEMDVWISKSILDHLKFYVHRSGMNSHFGTIPHKYAGKFKEPFNFSGKKVEQPQVAVQDLDPAQSFMRAQAEVVEAGRRLIEQNKAMQEQLNELEKKHELECRVRQEAEVLYKKLQEELKEKEELTDRSLQKSESLQKQLQELEKKYEVECRFRRQAESMLQRRQNALARMVNLEYSARQKSEALQKQLEEMELKYETERQLREEADKEHQLELEGYRHRLFELQEEVDRLSDQQPNQESNQEPKPEQEIPEVNRVFSLERFVDYALSLQTDEEAKAVVKLLREFCWHHNFLDPQAKGVIESILSKRREAEVLQQASGQQLVAGPTNYTYHIHQVGQLNPVATEINNQYGREE